MDEIVLKQLAFIRKLTLQAVEGLSEQTLDRVPAGFNNSVRWNLGHIYTVQEKFAFHFSGETLQLPESYNRLFAKGTKPADWIEADIPTTEELLRMLAEQPQRIQETLQHRMQDRVEQPFTTGSGLLLSTVGEFLNFTLYHEGMHFTAIGLLKRFTSA